MNKITRELDVIYKINEIVDWINNFEEYRVRLKSKLMATKDIIEEAKALIEEPFWNKEELNKYLEKEK